MKGFDDMMTLKEARKTLKELENFKSVIIGNNVIEKVGATFAVASVSDKSDLMHDYDAFTYGFKLKWVLDMLVRENAITA